MTAMAASLALTPATRAAADAGDAIAGALVGGIIGHAIARDQQRQRQVQTRTVYRAPAVSSAAREANREVQTSLNYFGFPAGGADGVLGSRSRGAISQYQATLGYPATGQLTPYERDFLVGSYHRAMPGGPPPRSFSPRCRRARAGCSCVSATRRRGSRSPPPSLPSRR